MTTHVQDVVSKSLVTFFRLFLRLVSNFISLGSTAIASTAVVTTVDETTAVVIVAIKLKSLFEDVAIFTIIRSTRRQCVTA